MLLNSQCLISRWQIIPPVRFLVMTERISYEDLANANEYFDRSITFFMCGKVEQAITAVKKAIEIYPEFAQAYNKLGDYLIKRGRVKEAADAYQTSLLYNSDSENTNFDMGCTLAHLGRYNEALTYLETALKMKPDHIQTYANIGRVYFMLGDSERAVSYLETALEADDLDIMANFVLGNILYDVGQTDRANEMLEWVIDGFKDTIKAKPSFAEAYYYIGYCKFIMGNYQEALENMLKAAEYDTAEIDYHYSFGMLYGDADVFCALAQIYSATGDRQKASESMKKAFEIEPENDRFREIARQLLLQA